MVPHHLSRNKNVTDRELRLWLILHSYTKGRVACSPSIQRLASDMGCSARTVQRLLHQMEAKKLISREERVGCATSYVPAPAASITKPTPVTAVTPDTHVTGDTDVTPPARFVTPTPDTGVTLREEVIKKSSLRSSSKNSEKTVAPPVVGDDRAPKVATPKKPPSEQRQLTDYFCHKWKETFGTTYPFKTADGVNSARMLKSNDLDTLKRCMDLFFADDDEWLRGKKAFGTFTARLPGYLSHPDITAPRRLKIAPTIEIPSGLDPYAVWDGKFHDRPDDW